MAGGDRGWLHMASEAFHVPVKQSLVDVKGKAPDGARNILQHMEGCSMQRNSEDCFGGSHMDRMEMGSNTTKGEREGERVADQQDQEL